MNDINVQELKERLDKQDSSFFLIDVREPNEHEAFNIGGQLIPLGTLPDHLDALQANKDQEIVLYCRSGARSGRAKDFLVQAGFTKVRNLLGGMLDWVDNFGQ